LTPKANKTKAFVEALPKNIFSGFVVSLIALPLGLGLAMASEAPPISGVIAAIVGGLVVSFLGGSNVTITGPGNGMVIVLLTAISTLGDGNMYQGYLITLAAIVVSGLVMILLGFLKMGKLADFFPASAIEGMLAAIGIGILSKQFHIMLGNNTINGSVISLLKQFPAAIQNLWITDATSVLVAAAIGILSLLIMVFYSKIRNGFFQLIPAPMWIIFLVVGLSYLLTAFNIEYPLPSDFLVNIPEDVTTNLTFPNFSKIFQFNFIIAVFSITLIASIESLLSIKAVDKLDPLNRRSNVNKDLKALGLATVVSGMLGGINVVTVIARSSVNVNNGATNRSANFFQAFFLAAFVLLFQEQLRKIPLAALAAILVYTGYKLATPKTLQKVARIGKEQIVIFLTTLLTTLFTNLITGISAGILITFIIHIILSKSFSLFFSHIAKPNILMFKEPDGGNFYISVKYFCSFLNFYKLKNKLDEIAEDKDVVLDFSMCNFVDHTALESIESYVDTFQKRGGSIELIGLDKHGADTEHPFAIRKILPFAKRSHVEETLTKRQLQLKNIALDFKWEYIPEKNKKTAFLSDFVFFKSREIRYFYNQLKTIKTNGQLMDVEFTEGAFIAREVIKTTLLYLPLPRNVPVFTLDKEGLIKYIYHLAGFKDIAIKNHPDFNRRFYLSGEKSKAIQELFTDELILFLESNPYYHIECNGAALLIIKKERLLSVQEVKAMLYFGKQLHQILQ